MTPQAELTLLEDAYTSILGGKVASYKIGTREVTKLDLDWVTKRMDLLRAQVIRQTSGGFFASQFRRPE